MAGLFVLFEGIDGSGKTTLSNRVADALSAGGLQVVHTRQGGRFASNVTQAIRELGRDARNLAMVPFVELMLYAARDAQLVEEVTRPALERADVVIADRYVYSAEVLARAGRGLAASEVEPIVRAATRGVTPDVCVLVDVDPAIARARRRVAKIQQRDPRPGSRKGLTGTGLQQRLREGYHALAAAEPLRWLVVDNTDADLDAMVGLLTELVRVARASTPAGAIARARDQARSLAPPGALRIGLGEPRDPGASLDLIRDRALEALLGWVDRRAVREPHVAAYFLAGLSGREVAARRRALVERAPEVVADGLTALADDDAWALRESLCARFPDRIARSLARLPLDERRVGAMIEKLLPVAPLDLAHALSGRDEPDAWTLRGRLSATALDEVAGSLRGIASDAAWALRDRWLADRGGVDALRSAYDVARIACRSVSGLDDPRAWSWRKAAREAAPVPALSSLYALDSARAWKWRDRHVARVPRTVLRSLGTLSDDRAWAMREAAAPLVREALDSCFELDVERAWALRHAHADRWPSSVVKSLGGLAASARGRELLSRQLARHGDDIAVLRQVAGLDANEID